MSAKTILVIDDSATIRRLVDSYLGPAGYQVILAGTAEDGLRLAEERSPDLILLDHQLPGTTGFEVCQKLLELPAARQTPVVVSSTLRKKAYVEYADLPNVVDMLPKPYTSDLLETTVANALDTGALIVESQEQGTAVPEVIQELGEPELSGSFQHFRLREVLDFLNNGQKSGVLEVEAEHRRIRFYLQRGRITGVTASGVDSRQLLDRLPPALHSLGPVLNLTLSGRGGSELDGVLELLDRKVLDPRLLRRLLRQQAALLTLDCFTQSLQQFRFQATAALPALQRKLPLDVSLMALLIDGALLCDPAMLPEHQEGFYVRRVTRGQNLDRAGVSAQHMKLLGLLNEPRSAEKLAQHLGWQPDDAARVLYGLMLAETVQLQKRREARQLIVFEPDPSAAQPLREFLARGDQRYQGRVVRDRLALQLVLKRGQAEALVFSLASAEAIETCRECYHVVHESLPNARWIALVPSANEPQACEDWSARLGVNFHATLPRPVQLDSLLQTLDGLFATGAQPPRDIPVAAKPSPSADPIVAKAQPKEESNDGHYFSIQT
jgi:CheY-like chemotaxis protein